MHFPKLYQLIWAFALLLLSISPVLAEQVKLGELTAQPGEAVSGYLTIEPLQDVGAEIPVSIIRGEKPGPTLALIAGTHGYEYAGIIALQRIRQKINPAELSGTLLLVHIANPPSFYGRTIYYSPADGQNLNRVYPGKADGTLSERIAYSITENVIEQSDFLVDLHAGDGNEALRPYVYLPETGQAKLDAASRGLAIAFGLDHIVLDKGRAQPPEASLYTDQTAISRGIPAITTETGQLGLSDDYWVSLAEDGIHNVMRHLGMLPSAEIPNEHIVWLEDYEVIRAPASGIFRPAVRDGYAIAENGLLGELVDPFGERITDLRAPFAGVINYVLGTPPVSEGEPVAMVSNIIAQ
ncbi:MAG: M14 family metallopeptidase [Xanthomonadales bacterium]|nr:M14 family metallopeptidase [Xanthomonadales bacterium]